MFGNIRKIFGEPPVERKIGDMEIDESGYIVPWAIRDGKLNMNYRIHSKKGGTKSVKVTRLGRFEFDVEYENQSIGMLLTVQHEVTEEE